MSLIDTFESFLNQSLALDLSQDIENIMLDFDNYSQPNTTRTDQKAVVVGSDRLGALEDSIRDLHLKISNLAVTNTEAVHTETTTNENICPGIARVDPLSLSQNRACFIPEVNSANILPKMSNLLPRLSPKKQTALKSPKLPPKKQILLKSPKLSPTTQSVKLSNSLDNVSAELEQLSKQMKSLTVNPHTILLENATKREYNNSNCRDQPLNSSPQRNCIERTPKPMTDDFREIVRQEIDAALQDFEDKRLPLIIARIMETKKVEERQQKKEVRWEEPVRGEVTIERPKLSDEDVDGLLMKLKQRLEKKQKLVLQIQAGKRIAYQQKPVITLKSRLRP